MKIWKEFGTEHSNRFVMKGEFKSIEKATHVHHLFEHLTEKLADKVEYADGQNRFTDEVQSILSSLEIFNLSPEELECFIMDHRLSIEDSTVYLETQEREITAFFKIFLGHGAKVEAYSEHDFPDSEDSKE